MPKAHQAIGFVPVQEPTNVALEPDSTIPNFILQSGVIHTRGLAGVAEGVAVGDCPADAA